MTKIITTELFSKFGSIVTPRGLVVHIRFHIQLINYDLDFIT